MLNIKDKGRIMQIKDHCQRIIDKLASCSKGSFDNDLDLIEIVCFNIFQIGELAKGLSNDFISTYNKLPWNLIKGMRDRIGHGYGSIDLDIVYHTSKEDIKELFEYCEEIIKNN